MIWSGLKGVIMWMAYAWHMALFLPLSRTSRPSTTPTMPWQRHCLVCHGLNTWQHLGSEGHGVMNELAPKLRGMNREALTDLVNAKEIGLLLNQLFMGTSWSF